MLKVPTTAVERSEDWQRLKRETGVAEAESTRDLFQSLLRVSSKVSSHSSHGLPTPFRLQPQLQRTEMQRLRLQTVAGGGPVGDANTEAVGEGGEGIMENGPVEPTGQRTY